jgi:hypothetical protein
VTLVSLGFHMHYFRMIYIAESPAVTDLGNEYLIHSVKSIKLSRVPKYKTGGFPTRVNV